LALVLEAEEEEWEGPPPDSLGPSDRGGGRGGWIDDSVEEEEDSIIGCAISLNRGADKPFSKNSQSLQENEETWGKSVEADGVKQGKRMEQMCRRSPEGRRGGDRGALEYVVRGLEDSF